MSQRVKIELSDKKDTRYNEITNPYTGNKLSGRSYFKIEDVNEKHCYEKPARVGSQARYLFHNRIFWVLSYKLKPDISTDDVVAYTDEEHFPLGYTHWTWKVEGDQQWVVICMNTQFLPGTTQKENDGAGSPSTSAETEVFSGSDKILSSALASNDSVP